MLPGCPGDEPVPLRWGDRQRGAAVAAVWPDKAALLQAPGAQGSVAPFLRAGLRP